MTSRQQLPLIRLWGGKRRGAGRPPGGRASHHPRPRFGKPTPAHVTVRVRRHVWNLRSRRCHRRIEECLARACGRLGLRVIEYAVLGNHLHFIVEADDSEALSRGMQGLGIRIARSLNALMSARGSVFDDHYDARLLTTPTQLVRALAYVLDNARRHFGAVGRDRYSSDALGSAERQAQLGAPVSWLLTVGWRRAKAADRNRLRNKRFTEETS
jgi:REP-associated tyrosine transposase